MAGLSQSMLELIAFRAVQGLGAGGLIIGAQAIVGDVVSPRQRGRYQGLFGAVFGVATVLGPLLGGFFVDYLSWRWVFYVNLPIGVVALFVTSAQLPGHHRKVRHVIDYAGTILLALATTALVLFTSLGGTTFAWTSGPIVAMAAAGVMLTIMFVLVERRAAEPILPLGLFANRVFSTAGAIGFVLGFAMFGALTFLPIFFQDARGLSPTMSGLQLLPLVGGLLLASIASGQLVSRWGRYKVFPVVGTFFMVVGLYLLSGIGLTTGGLTHRRLSVRVRCRLGTGPADPGGRSPERRALRAARHGDFGSDLLPQHRRVVRHGNIRRHLRQSPGKKRNPWVAPRRRPTESQELSERAPTRRRWPACPERCTPGWCRAWCIPSRPCSSSRRRSPQWRSSSPGCYPTSNCVRRCQPISLVRRPTAAHRSRTCSWPWSAWPGERTDWSSTPPWPSVAACGWTPDHAGFSSALPTTPIAHSTKCPQGCRSIRSRSRGSITALLDAGLIETTHGPGECEFSLTKDGLQATNRLLTIRRAAFAQMLDGWDLEAHPEIGEMIRQLAHELRADDAKLLADATTFRGSAL